MRNTAGNAASCGTTLSFSTDAAQYTTNTIPWAGNTTTYWPYQPYATEARVAELEGEVKVLREMVAALVGGGSFKPRARKAKAK